MVRRTAHWIKTTVFITDDDLTAPDPPESSIKTMTRADKVTLWDHTVGIGAPCLLMEISKGAYWDRQFQNTEFSRWCQSWWLWVRNGRDLDKHPERHSPIFSMNEVFLE